MYRTRESGANLFPQKRRFSRPLAGYVCFWHELCNHLSTKAFACTPIDEEGCTARYTMKGISMVNSVCRTLFTFSLLVFAGIFSTAASAQLIGPYPGGGLSYRSFANSPFKGGLYSYFHLEDFEDHLLDKPGVSASAGGVTSVIFGPGYHDSVDADDGVIDGSGLLGDSYFYRYGNMSILFRFDASVLGELPTHAGLVWTDGESPIIFEAFDANGASLGILNGSHSTSGYTGQTDEDRFYGAIHGDGISAIRIGAQYGGIEIDHLQFGRIAAVPEPGVLAMLAGMAAFGGGLLLRRRRS